LFEFECIITMLNLRVRKKDTFWNQITLLLIIILFFKFGIWVADCYPEIS
jgi:hypothetical protein